MPRITEETLVGYRFDTFREQVPVSDNGSPIFNGDGKPKTEQQTKMVFVCQQTGHVVNIPLTEQGREELVKQLTGGVVLAAPGDGKP